MISEQVCVASAEHVKLSARLPNAFAFISFISLAVFGAVNESENKRVNLWALFAFLTAYNLYMVRTLAMTIALSWRGEHPWRVRPHGLFLFACFSLVSKLRLVSQLAFNFFFFAAIVTSNPASFRFSESILFLSPSALEWVDCFSVLAFWYLDIERNPRAKQVGLAVLKEPVNSKEGEQTSRVVFLTEFAFRKSSVDVGLCWVDTKEICPCF